MMQTKTKKLLAKLTEVKLDAENKLFFRKYGRLVSALRRDPVLQARLMHGIVIPPHERVMCRPTRWTNYDEFHYVGGRGVAKSFVVASMIPTLHGEVYGRKKLSSLSASRFRGGKVIMEEATQLLMGGLSGQQESAPFAREMLTWKAGVKREADRWYIRFTNESVLMTVPTGNEETARGLRAHMLFLDEADNWNKNSVDKIFGPYLAVKSNFAAPGRAGSSNKIFFTGTVSYTHKDWAKALHDRENIIRKKWQAYQFFDAGDFDTWRRLLTDDNERVKFSSTHLQRWDYTDLLIPTILKSHEVVYPSINRMTGKIEIDSDDFVQYDPKDRKNYIYTYPVDKTYAEKGLEDGLTDFDT